MNNLVDPTNVILNNYLDTLEDDEKRAEYLEQNRHRTLEIAKEKMLISLGNQTDMAQEAIASEWIQKNHYLVIASLIESEDYTSLGQFVANNIVDYMIPQYWDESEQQMLEEDGRA